MSRGNFGELYCWSDRRFGCLRLKEKPALSSQQSGFSLVKAAGVEPASENLSTQASPSAVCHQHSLVTPPTDRQCVSVAPVRQESRGTLILTFTTHRRLIQARGPARSDGCLIKQQLTDYRERLFLSFGYYRGPALCSLPMLQNPRRNLYAPIFTGV